MKLTLIRPAIGRRNDGKFDKSAIEPLELEVVAALTPENTDIKIYDDRIEKIPYDEETDLVGITMDSFTAKRAYEIASEYKKRDKKVVFGGMHATLLPEEALEHGDSVLIGDAEEVWDKLIFDFKRGRMKPLYRGGFSNPQNGGLPRRDLLKNKKYLPLKLIQFSRGCPFRCNFCAPSVYFNAKHFHRRIDEVIREISEQNLKILMFVDDNITANKQAAKDLIRELIPLKVKWGSQGSIDMAKDPELMDLMTQSGCLGHVVGIESNSSENMSFMNKSPNIKNDVEKLLDAYHDHGLQIWAALTVGHDFDTPESLKRLLDFTIEKNFTFAAFNMLMPYPSTPLYKTLETEGRLLYGGKWWLHEDYRYNYAPFIPKNMTSEQLTEICYTQWSDFYSFSSVFKRSLDFTTNASSVFKFGIHWIYNIILGREFHKMNGMKFGISDEDNP